MPSSFLLCILNAQEKINETDIPDKFINENTQWTEVYLNWGTLQWVENLYELNGTVAANNNTYWKIYKNGEETAWLREDNQHNLYISNWKEPWQKGDKIRYGKENTDNQVPSVLIEHEIEDIEYIKLKDGKEYPIVDRIIYSIGSVEGVLNSYLIRPEDMSETGLLDYYRNGEMLYENQTLLQKRASMEKLQSVSNIQADKKMQIRKINKEIIFSLKEKLSNNEKQTLSIYSIEGKKLLESNLISGSISINNLPTGYYFYRLNQDNDLLETGKFLN